MCQRNYTSSAITELQRISEAVEAERRRRHRAELAEELRQWISERKAILLFHESPVADDHWAELCRFSALLDELAPPGGCDSVAE